MLILAVKNSGRVQTGCRGRAAALQAVHKPQPDASRVQLGGNMACAPCKSVLKSLNAVVQSNTVSHLRSSINTTNKRNLSAKPTSTDSPVGCRATL